VLKQAGVVAAAAAAGLMILAAPALAGTPEGHAGHGHGPSQVGLLNLDDTHIADNVNVPLGACGNDVGVLGAAVPIGSSNDTEHCSGGVIVNPVHESHNHGQVGVVNLNQTHILDNVNIPVGVCSNDVGVLGAAVPIGSSNDTGLCTHGGIIH
jgi:hypothetical protein